MKIFWPHRADAKGFSIENLSRKYHEKISSDSSKKKSNHLLDDGNLDFKNKDSKKFILSQLSQKRGHWANRDFSEYREAA